MIALGIILLLIILILLAPVKAELALIGRETFLQVYVFGIPVFKIKPKKGVKKEPASPEKAARSFDEKVTSFTESVRKFVDLFKTAARLSKRHIKMEKFSIHIDVGTSDAAFTAVSTGALWASAYALLSIAGTLFPIEKHDIKVVPQYNQTVFNSEVRCIFKSRIAYIIIIAVTILMKIK